MVQECSGGFPHLVTNGQIVTEAGTLSDFFVSVDRWHVDRPGFDAHCREDFCFCVDYSEFLCCVPHVGIHGTPGSVEVSVGPTRREVLQTRRERIDLGVPGLCFTLPIPQNTWRRSLVSQSNGPNAHSLLTRSSRSHTSRRLNPGALEKCQWCFSFLWSRQPSSVDVHSHVALESHTIPPTWMVPSWEAVGISTRIASSRLRSTDSPSLPLLHAGVALYPPESWHGKGESKRNLKSIWVLDPSLKGGRFILEEVPAFFQVYMREQNFTEFQPWFDTRNDESVVYKLQEKVFKMKTSTTTHLQLEKPDRVALDHLRQALPYYTRLTNIAVNGTPLTNQDAIVQVVRTHIFCRDGLGVFQFPFLGLQVAPLLHFFWLLFSVPAAISLALANNWYYVR